MMRKYYLVIFLLILFKLTGAQNLPYVNQTDVGLLIGNKSVVSFSAQSFNGVIIDKWKIHLGFITGIDVYQPITFIPLAPSIKYLPFSTKKTNPYLSLTAGYSFSGLKKFQDNQIGYGGILFNPSLGLRFKSQRKAAFNLNFGYKIQKGKVVTLSDSFISPNPRFKNKIVDNYTFKRISFTLGLSF
jgi:hypothetical protein